MPQEISILDTITGDNEPTRDPNDFRRRGPQGPPIVASLTKTRQPKGNKPELLAKAEQRGIELPDKVTVAVLKELLGEESADETYGRPSSYGDEIDNAHNLIKWKERQVALGIAMDPTVLERLQGIDVDEETAVLDGIVARAHEVADSDLASDRGTWVHVLTEWADEQQTPITSLAGAPWRDPRFGISDEQTLAIANGWRKLLVDNGLEVMSSEVKVINDDLHLAGSLDRHLRTTKRLDFAVDVGQMLTISEGHVVVGDIKTSKLRTATDGSPSYWETYPLQVLSYTEGRPYDVHADTRGEWPYTLNMSVALICHFDVDELLENGRAVWQLIAIDLEVARQGMRAVEAAKAYKAATKFVMPATVTAVDVDPWASIKRQYESLDDADKARFLALDIDRTDLAASQAALDPLQQQSPPPVVRQPLGTRPEAPKPDEGDTLPSIPWLDRYDALDDVCKQWVGGIAKEAAQVSMPIEPRDQITARRVFAYGALVVFAGHFIRVDDTPAGRADADGLLYACLSSVDPGTPTRGHAVGSLGHAEALTFAQTVNALVAGRLQPTFDQAGRWILAPSAA